MFAALLALSILAPAAVSSDPNPRKPSLRVGSDDDDDDEGLYARSSSIPAAMFPSPLPPLASSGGSFLPDALPPT